MIKGYRYSYSYKDCSYNVNKELNRNKNLQKPIQNNSMPNKTELKLLNILKVLDKDWIYTGNGSKTIEGKKPDFVNEKLGIIIEMNGIWWHRNEKVEDLQNRYNLFKSKGYETIFIWENEVDMNIVCNKLSGLVKSKK